MCPTVPDTDPFAHLPGRTPLFDEGAGPLLVFTLADSTRGERPWVNLAWRPPSADVDACCQAVLDAFAGYAFTSVDRDLAGALLAEGAAQIRHAHTMSHFLDSLPAAPMRSGLVVTAMTAAELQVMAAELGEINVRAYPPGHPDYEHDDEAGAAEQLRRFARGEVLGPYLETSTVAALDGRLVGACIAVDREGDFPAGGPWIVDIFRDPDVGIAGIGTALLAGFLRMCRDRGLAEVSLVVTDSNERAHRSYARNGFVDRMEKWTLALPRHAT